jgi:hypothetical protein
VRLGFGLWCLDHVDGCLRLDRVELEVGLVEHPAAERHADVLLRVVREQFVVVRGGTVVAVERRKRRLPQIKDDRGGHE